MAGDWIPVRLDIHEDPAVLEISERLGVRAEAVVGYCVKFWCWVSRQCNAPSVTGVTLRALGDSIGLPGFPELLVEVGWLEYDASGSRPVITIPNYDRWLSQSAKKRAQTSKRVAKSRMSKGGGGIAECNAPSVTNVLHPLLSSNVSVDVSSSEDVLIPSSLDTPEFRKAWEKWLDYVAAVNGHVQPLTADQQLAELARRGGPAEAIAIVERSIRDGSRGKLYYDDFAKASGGAPKKRGRLPPIPITDGSDKL